MPELRSAAIERSAGARSAVNVGHPRWSSTKARSAPGRREAQHQLDHVVAVLAADPRRPHDGRVGPGQLLAGELRDPVHRLRVRRVVLAVRAIERAVEDVVGAHVDEMGADLLGDRRDVADRVGVDRSGDVDVRLARVDRGVRRGVDDGIRPGVADRRPDGRRVGDVECGAVDCHHVVTCRKCGGHDVVAELPARARDEQPHRVTLAGSQAGFGLQRLPPVAVVAVPVDRRGERVVEAPAERPSEIA